ncbi:protein disulfide oxidoreductase [Vibrio sp. HN007]|uniref:protein disulfide oxidoreductase n=1 Tax=Vibrio iocasae TaxID=3098914 RepID=UPI0035D49808
MKIKLRKWLKELVSILIILTIVSIALDYYRSFNMPKGNVPALITETLDGQRVDLVEMSQEQPVILYFWATWCGPCKVVSPTVNQFAENSNVVTIALSSGPDEKVERYLETKDYQFPVVNDINGKISQRWNVQITPTIVIINKGEIKSITTGITSPVGLWIRTLLA